MDNALIRVAIIEDNSLIREGLAALLNQAGECTQAATDEEQE